MESSVDELATISLNVVQNYLDLCDEEGLASTLLAFLYATIRDEDREAREHCTGFAGETFAPNQQGERLAFWSFTLRRCDTDEALCRYVMKSFRNYCRKQHSQDHREYDALRQIIKRALESEMGRKSVRQILVQNKRNKEAYLYGLFTWDANVDAVGVFDGCWHPESKDSEQIKLVALKLNSSGRYEREDIIAACKTLLKLAGKYCDSTDLCRGVSTFWVDCSRTALQQMIHLEEDRSVGEIDQGDMDPILCEEWPLEDVARMASRYLDQHFDARDLFIVYHRLLNPERRRTLHELGAELAVSHVTVANIEARVTRHLKEWLGGMAVDERCDYCRVLPNVVKKLLECRLSVNEKEGAL